MPEQTDYTFSGYLGIDIESAPESVPQNKLRRAEGVDFAREAGVINIRRGQSKLNSTAIDSFDAHIGYTNDADAFHAPAPSWRFTQAANDAKKTFTTQIWEKQFVEGVNQTPGTTIGIFAFEQDNHGATNIPQGSEVFAMFRSQGVRYERVNESLYKDFSSLATGFKDARSQMVPFRPLNDTTTWTFIADDTFMARTDGTDVFNWSITAPTKAATVVAKNPPGLTGQYSWRYTYARQSGTAVLVESNPSPASILGPNGEGVSVTVTETNDPQVTHVRVYRTVANGSVHLFERALFLTESSFISKDADTLLGSALETDNDPVPKADLAATYLEHVFLDGDVSNPGYLWVTKRFKPWSVPATNFLEMNQDDPGRAIVSWGTALIRFTRDTKYRILGSNILNFFPVEAASKRGILKGKAFTASEQGVWFMANDGVYLTDGIVDQEVSRDIRPIFQGRTVDSNTPVNKDGNHVLEFYKNRLYCFYAGGTATEPSHKAVLDLRTNGWHIETMSARSTFFEREIDILVRGGSDGFGFKMEDEAATGDAGTDIIVDLLMSEATPNGTSTFRRYIKANVDADTQDESITMSLFLDGTSVDSVTLKAASRKLFREAWDGGQIGQRGALRFEYTGTKDIRVGAAAILFDQLEGV